MSEVKEKKPWESKTIWLGVAVALLPLFPAISLVVSGNPELVSLVLGGLFTALRIISKDKINIS